MLINLLKRLKNTVGEVESAHTMPVQEYVDESGLDTRDQCFLRFSKNV